MWVQSSVLAVIFAIASALTTAWATVVRHRVVINAGERDPIVAGVTNPVWWLSIAAAFGAYLLQIVALGFGTLLVVQPILVLSLMFTLLLSARMNRQSLRRYDISWAGVLTVAVIIVVVYGRPEPGDAFPDLTRWWFAVAVGAIVFLLLAVLAYRRAAASKALILGAICGGIFGFVAVLSKLVADRFFAGGFGELVSSWELYALIFSAVLGTAVQQLAFAAGNLATSLPAMTVVEPVVAFTLGYVVLGEEFRVESTLGWIVMLLAVAAMFVGTFRLARRRGA